MNCLIFITGGASSGKSEFAEKLSILLNEQFNDKKQIAYIATSEIMDNEFKEKVEKHQKRRNNIFKTYEENLNIDKKIENNLKEHNVFLLESLTTWLGNIFVKINEPEIEQFIDKCLNNFLKIFNLQVNIDFLNEIKEKKSINEIIKKTKKFNKLFIIVSDEVGLGIVPDNALARKYRNLLGKTNKKIADASNYAFFVISGIPQRIK